MNNKTEVVNCKKEEYDIYIGRPFGPYKPPEFGGYQLHFGNPFHIRRDGNRKTVITKFEKWIRGEDYKRLYPKRKIWILKNLYRLKNKRIGCFCSPKACHGDIYVKLIIELNGERNNLLKTGEKDATIHNG